MKKIECIIRPEKFDDVYQAIRKSGAGGMSVIEIEGFGNQRAPGKSLVEKIKIEIYADAFQVEVLVDTIMKAARTGKVGDGKIAVISLEKIYRIRTGESGARAIRT